MQHHGAHLDVSGKERETGGTNVVRDMGVSPEYLSPEFKRRESGNG